MINLFAKKVVGVRKMKLNKCRRCEAYISRICKGKKDVSECDGFRDSACLSMPVPLDLDLVRMMRKLRRKINGEESVDNIKENIALLLREGLEDSEMKQYYDRFSYDESDEKFYLR